MDGDQIIKPAGDLDLSGIYITRLPRYSQLLAQAEAVLSSDYLAALVVACLSTCQRGTR